LARDPSPCPALELLVDAELYTPEPMGRRHVLVGGERILWIGATLPQLPADLGVRTVNVGGQRVVPGLVDGHAHVSGGGGEAGYASRVPAPRLSDFTRAGVTSVVGLLGTDDTVRSPAEVLAHARALEAEGLSAFMWTGGYHLPPRTLLGSVREDMFAIDLVIGVGELALSDHRSSQPNVDELLRIAADVHVGGLMTGKAGVLHLHMGDGERGLELVFAALDLCELPARVFHPTHVNRRRALFDEAIELAGRGATIDVTAFPAGDDGDGLGAVEAVEAFVRTGVDPERLTVSSDGGGCLPRFDSQGRAIGFGVGTPSTLAATLAALVARGLPLEQALLPFTRNPARHLRLDRKGEIRVGMDADLLVLDTRGLPRDVMARGVWHVRDGRAVVRGTFEDPIP